MPRLTVVISQTNSHNPAKRKLEEEIVAALLGERGIEVTVVPHLYDLSPEGTGMLCLQGIAGDMIVLSWLYPRAARWILGRNGVRGQEGQTLLEEELDEDELDDEEAGADEEKDRVIDELEIPARHMWCLDLRLKNQSAPYIEEIKRIAAESSVATVELTGWIAGNPKPEQMQRYLQPAPGNVESNGNGAVEEITGLTPPARQENGSPTIVDEETARRWYPVIDFSRCTNCMECIDFCLFGVYGVDVADHILVEQPDNCRKGCPACSRVCPENAIIFPQHKTPAIAGSAEIAGGLKIDLSKLFGAPDMDAVDIAVRERDEQLVMVGRDAVGHEVGLQKRQADKDQGPKDELDDLVDEIDALGL